MITTPFTKQVGIDVPLICGAMYPCSNLELVAAVSNAGGIGVIQPLSMVYVFKHDFRSGLRRVRELTDRPFGLNLIIERSSKVYLKRTEEWLGIALEEGVRFFVTALSDPRWVVEQAKARAADAIIYHDVTERKWAEKAVAAGVDGLICVNRRAGGHAGTKSPQELYDALRDLGRPLICAGGVGDECTFVEAMNIGYAGVQMGTRFIASTECKVHEDYKQAILAAKEEDVVLTDKISGVPVSVINTPHVASMGTKAGWLARRLLRWRRTRHWMRLFYTVRSVRQLGKASQQGRGYRDFFQAGKSVAGVDKVEPAGDIVRRFAATLEQARRS